ncbi:MAG: hypothetical protein IPK16_19705 [Anaerolineales bacterium]|nr:hypothetical protein [Anaerolineales bacterium]
MPSPTIWNTPSGWAHPWWNCGPWGGPSRSPLWCQIIADICGRPVSVLAGEQGAPFGNALLAGVGAGLILDPAEVALRCARIADAYLPDPVRHEQYRRLFEFYKQLYPQLKDLYAGLAQG